MDKKEKLLYDIGFAVIGIVLGISAYAAIFAHLQIEQLDTMSGQVSRFFFSDAQQQYEDMKTLRLVGTFVSLGGAVGITVMSNDYYRRLENTEWELKKGIGSSLLLILIGTTLYYFTEDIFPQAVGLSSASMGLFMAILCSAILVAVSGGFEQGSSAGTSDAYCQSCGSGVSESASFCENCGSSL